MKETKTMNESMKPKVGSLKDQWNGKSSVKLTKKKMKKRTNALSLKLRNLSTDAQDLN